MEDGKHLHVVGQVAPDSIAGELGVAPGDVLVEINGNKIEDIFDYQYYTQDEYIEVLIRKPSGEEWILEIDKEYDEDLGITFENGLMDDYPATTSASSALSTRCRRECGTRCILRMMTQGFRFCRETM